MSEDSDYTSDINYPLRDQYNTSAHQFPSEHPYAAHREDSRDSRDSRESERYYSPREYFQDSFEQSFDQDPYDRTDPYDRGYDRDYEDAYERGYEQGYSGGYYDDRDTDLEAEYDRERDYYNNYNYPESPYQPGRSDTDSEPLYYNSRPNSRPQSFMTDR